jgi:hypothetical protein
VIAVGWLALMAVGVCAMIVFRLCTRGAQRVTELQAGDVLAPRGGYVLGASGLLFGQGDGGQTIVRPLPGDTAGPIVRSAELAMWKASGKGQWAYEGVPTGLIVRDLTFDGQDRVTPNPHLWDNRSGGAPAIELYAPGARVQNVKVFDRAGVGLVVGHGAAPMKGWGEVTDSWAIRIQSVKTSRTHAGVWVTSSGDGLADDLELSDGRDFGARFDGAAWLISRVHAAGYLAQPTAADPDLGCGIINGRAANYYGVGIQPDNCRVGFRNYGLGTSVDELIGKLCSEITVDAVRKLHIERCMIETVGGASWMQHFNPAARGIVVRPTAEGSILGNERSIWSTGDATECVMASVQANRCEIRNSRDSWGGGGKENGNACVEYGSPTENLWGGRIDVWASGFGCGVRLTHLIGRGNTIVVHHNGNCAVPIDLGPNTDLSGNDVRVEDAQTGTWTTIATKDGATMDEGK